MVMKFEKSYEENMYGIRKIYVIGVKIKFVG